jgi:hypothetical protein
MWKDIDGQIQRVDVLVALGQARCRCRFVWDLALRWN